MQRSERTEGSGGRRRRHDTGGYEPIALAPAGARTFEGDDLPSVLAEVMAELGPDAAILAANKVRTGGVAGFFSRERFEVLAAPAAPVRRDAPVPATERPVADSGRSDRQRAGSRRDRAERAVAGADHVQALLALADAMEDQVAVEPRRSPRAMAGGGADVTPGSTVTALASASDEQTFGEFLAQAVAAPEVIDLADRAEPIALPRRTLRPIRPVPALAAARARMLPTPEEYSGPEREPAPQIVVAHTSNGVRLAKLRPAFQEVPRLTRAEARAATAAATSGVSTASDPVVAAAVVQAAVAQDASLTAASLASTPARRTASAATPAVAALQEADARPSELTPDLEAALAIARAVIAGERPGGGPSAGEEIPDAAWSPVPPLDRPGIVLVIGDAPALAHARHLAGRAGRQAADVLVAAPRRPDDVRAWAWIKDPAEAGRRRERWAARPDAVLVAVVIDPDDAGVAFARSVIEHAGADHVRLVTSAAAPAWTSLHDDVHAVEFA